MVGVSLEEQLFLGPKFEASAHPNDVELFAAFANWIGELLRNPEKFT